MSDFDKELEKDFNSRFDYSIIESVLRDMGDEATWLVMKKHIMEWINKNYLSRTALIEMIEKKKINKNNHADDCNYKFGKCSCGLIERMIYDKALSDILQSIKQGEK